MTEEEFLRIRDYLKLRYGIDMNHKKTIVEGRLENYVRQNGYLSYSQYMDALESDVSGEMEKKLVDILTTNHTYFMRESEHFDYLRKEVLPWLKKKEAINKDLRIWCAASSSGEEPYTIAMVLLDYFGLEKMNGTHRYLRQTCQQPYLQKQSAEYIHRSRSHRCRMPGKEDSLRLYRGKTVTGLQMN